MPRTPRQKGYDWKVDRPQGINTPIPTSSKASGFRTGFPLSRWSFSGELGKACSRPAHLQVFRKDTEEGPLGQYWAVTCVRRRRKSCSWSYCQIYKVERTVYCTDAQSDIFWGMLAGLVVFSWYNSVPDWLMTVTLRSLFGGLQMRYPLPEKGINRLLR